jgi:2-keto-4-pentenoate hydratase/2-oxohepta-3-ene-1,7-dioic acid hydratase in catechol pathway
MTAAVNGTTYSTGNLAEPARVRGTETFPWLRPGDRVRLEVERLGSLESTVQPAQPLHPL